MAVPGNGGARTIRVAALLLALALVPVVLPFVLTLVPVASGRFLVFVVVTYGYAGAAILAAASLAWVVIRLFRSPPPGPARRRRGLGVLGIALAVLLATAMVLLLRESGSVFWYLVYLLFLPSAVVVGAHEVLLGFFDRVALGRVPSLSARHGGPYRVNGRSICQPRLVLFTSRRCGAHRNRPGVGRGGLRRCPRRVGG